jgi:uncharacterized protein YrzB (UPF0473 family)
MKGKIFLVVITVLFLGITLTSCAKEEVEVETGIVFKDATTECSLTVPENWAMKELEQKQLGPNVFLVQFFSDDFDSNIVFLAQSNSMAFMAKEAVEIDISNMQANKDVDFGLISKGPINLKDYDAYQMVDEFSQRGITFYQKRIYIVTDKFLYGIILNSKTEEAFSEDVLVFDEVLKTLVITK